VKNAMDVRQNNAVEIKNLTFSWMNHTRIIFNDISLNAPQGKITAIMGPSGSGKTTLLKIIGGQLPVLHGTVKFYGKDMPTLSRDELYQARRQIGMLFQSGALFSEMSVFDNVAFPLREHTDLPENMIRDLVLMKLEAVGLRGARDLMPSELSGGMRRRAALARTIALDPSLIMYDEPFAGQDPITMGMLAKLIKLLNDALNLTSIVVSHDVPETLAIADYIYLIADKKIVGEGTPQQMKETSSEWVKQFVHALPDGPVPFHYPAKEYQDDLLGEV